MSTQADTAAAFRKLHQGPLLVLPNAWDAGSARLMESLGAKAIATTSAGVAWAHGYPDGDTLPVRLLLETVAAIVRVVRVPVSVDSEGGYSDDPLAVGETVGKLVEAGAVGINIEDGELPPDLLCRKIEQSRKAAQKRGVALFVNARTDVYLHGLVPAEKRVEETLARAGQYRDAGADGIFVPFLSDPEEIRKVTAAVALPVNVLARPGLPAAAALETLGVRRLSAGSGISQAVWGRARTLAAAFIAEGRSDILAEGAMPYAEINPLIGAPR